METDEPNSLHPALLTRHEPLRALTGKSAEKGPISDVACRFCDVGESGRNRPPAIPSMGSAFDARLDSPPTPGWRYRPRSTAEPGLRVVT